MSLPILAITMGDPAGIGAEIAAKTLAEQETYKICRPLVIGDACVMEDAVRLCKLDLAIHAIDDPAAGTYRFGSLDVLDLAFLEPDEHRYKQVTARQGDAAFHYVAKAIELAMAGQVDGTVTGPINKESLNLAGHHYSGHTEIYGGLTRTKDYAMMLADGDFRVVHVSTHVSLRQACDRVKTPRVLRVIELADAALKQLGIAEPRIGVCGLNPHCGEARMFGTEDEDEIRPAVEQARGRGIAAEGPLPADTIFSKMAGGMFDIVVAMYHDQGHIPTKLVGFKYDGKTDTWAQMAGVNITLGLPIIRVSVDHGTAFDRAGEGRANPQSLIEAVRYASRFARGAANR
ncbi:4-hydroxythreonine-4-phosphate dehydrogenase PdxA [Shumkonia mesophila]|uniref:4-hydroxythreonine-4-phosphate dehydrogenase PdxA n=1 Tax=Shumkonia mesophila TaxID=2838854 RepID=UPI00293492A9|nr:4-hydroxythreonine-4-phosphate dehydrogenase PdxA [Shumkonia mesophila]